MHENTEITTRSSGRPTAGPLPVALVLAACLAIAGAQTPAPPAQPSLPPAPAENLEKQLQTLNAHYLSKQFVPAVEGYINFLASYPDAPERDEALYKLGDCYFQAERPDEALKTFDMLLKDLPQSTYVPHAKMRRGKIFMGQGKTADALAMFLDVLDISKSQGLTLNARFEATLALSKLGRIDEAVQHLEALRTTEKNNPYKAFANLGLGRSCEANKEYQKALEYYRASLSAADTAEMRGEAGVRAGMMALALKLYKDAAGSFDSVRRVDAPEQWRQLSNIGLIRAKFFQEDYESVIDLYPEMELALPKDGAPEALYYLANARRFTKNHAVALATYNHLLEGIGKGTPYEEPASYERLLVMHLEGGGDMAAAADAFLGAFPNSERVPVVRYLKAETLFDDNKFEEAGEIFAKIAADAKPEHAVETAVFKRAWCLHACQRNEDAADAFEKFLMIYPASTAADEALWQLGLARQKTGEYDRSLEAWETLVDKHPSSTHVEQALYSTGALLGKQGKLEKARDALNRYLRLFPKGKYAQQSRYWRGWTMFELKDYAESLADLTATRKLEPDFYAPATQRMLFAAYQLKKSDLVAAHLKEWDELLQKKADAGPPAEPSIVLWLGQQFSLQKKWAEADACFSRVLASGDAALRPDALYGAGIALLQLKKYASSIQMLEDYRIAVGDCQQGTEAMLPIAKAHLGSGNYPLASTFAEQLMLRLPEGRFNAEARMVVADAYMGREMFAEAAKYYSSVALLHEDDEIVPDSVKKAAAAYRKAGNPAEAARVEAEQAKRKKKKISAPATEKPAP